MTSTSTSRLPLVALSVLFLVAGCSTDEPDTQEETPLTQVEVIAVGEEPAVVPVQTSGQLASETEARLSFKIPGIVQRVLIDEGQQVRRGQLLAQLDPVEIQAQVRQAKSGLDKATRDAERARNLYEDKVATLAQVQDAETAQEVAQAAFDAATFNARHARIYAPTSGRVLQRFAEEGELVNAGTPVLTFGETGGAWAVRAGLSDRDVVRLQVGDSARVHFDAYPGGPFSARVTEIAGAPDPRTSTYEVELRLSSDERPLYSGFIGEVDIFPATAERYTMLPLEAVLEPDGRAGYVYVLNGTTAQRRDIVIGRLFDDRVGISSGLTPGDRVVTQGAAFLDDGERVSIRADM